jgi:hypothetical protein
MRFPEFQNLYDKKEMRLFLGRRKYYFSSIKFDGWMNDGKIGSLIVHQVCISVLVMYVIAPLIKTFWLGQWFSTFFVCRHLFHNVSLRTSNWKKSREFSQKRFIGTECTRFISIKSRERMRPRFVQMNWVHQLRANKSLREFPWFFFWLEVRMVLYEIVSQNLEIVLCTWFRI